MHKTLVVMLSLLGVLCTSISCTSYKVKPDIPDELRSISVPVFENASGFPEIDALVTQEILREFQREGTFKIAQLEHASLKLLGKVEPIKRDSINYDRNFGTRTSEYRYILSVRITLVERGTGKLLIDDMPITASTTFLTRGDLLTGMQDAQPRVAKSIARAVTDAVLDYWSDKK